MDDQGALGLHPVWLDEGAHILMDKLFGLGSGPVMYNSEPDDGHCTNSLGNRLSSTTTKLGHPRTAFATQSANPRQGRSLSH